MTMTDKPPPPQAPDHLQGQATWPVVLKRLAIWALCLAVLYLARDFFFAAFMTFLFSYFTLALVGWGMKRLSPDRERPALRRLLTVAVFVLAPLVLLGVGVLVGPRLVAQAESIAGWLGHINPETEVQRNLEKFIGPSEFRQQYGTPDDPRYQKGLDEFRTSPAQHVQEYYDFPTIEAWMEAGFSKQFTEAERGRIRARLTKEGTSSQDFEQWFLSEKFPKLKEQARKEGSEQGHPSASVDRLVRAAASTPPDQLLQQVRRDPAALAVLRQEWINDAVERGVAAAKVSPVYREQFRAYYDRRRQQRPKATPYTFDQYVALQEARPKGLPAFGATLEKLIPSTAADGESRLRADFEAAKKHELFQQWWGSSSTAKFIRQQIESSTSGGGSERMERFISSLLNIPVDLATALILSFFICIDFPTLQRGFRRLRDTALRDVYEEIVPPLSSLGLLTGRSMRAQGMIALCNATVIFVGLTILGVEHAVLLCAAVFVLCLVPTLGMVISWVLLAGVAFIQPGGGLLLAAKVTGVVLVAIFLETFVFSPRILGRMMELHPVLLLALLPIAQYFFGVWGLILATPVAVYVVHVLILRRGLPGVATTHGPPAAGRPLGGAPERAGAVPPDKDSLAEAPVAKSEVV
jgi:predicted PurR-regulated permease PerM